MTTKNKLSVSRKKIKKVKGWAYFSPFDGWLLIRKGNMKRKKAGGFKVHKATLHIEL